MINRDNLMPNKITGCQSTRLANTSPRCITIRDYRINELDRAGCRASELDEWIGNTEEVRRRHYRTNSVNSSDRQTARLRGQNESCTTDSEIVYQIVSDENAQPDPKELVQQILEAGKGSGLLEMLENALKETDPASRKYTPEDSNL